MMYLIIEAALRALALAAVVGLGLTVLRVRNVPARKAAWSMVLIASMAMPLLMHWPANFAKRFAWVVPVPAAETLLPQKKAAGTPAVMMVNESPRPESSVARMRWTSAKKTAVASPIVDDAQGAIAGPATTQFSWPPAATLVIWVYLSVAGALLLRLLYGLLAAIHLYATAARVSPLVAPEGCVRSSSRIASPVAIGSAVVLPADYTQWTPRKRRMVLAHEYSHVRQLDFYLQLLAGVYTALFWFSPLGWFLRRRLASLGERIADRAGMHAGESRSGYAELVLEFAAMPRTNLRGVAMARSGNLTHRIESMLNERVFRSAFAEGRHRAAAALLVVPAALFVVTALVRVPVASAKTEECARAMQPNCPAAAKGPIGRPRLLPSSAEVRPEDSVLSARLELVQAPAPAPRPDPAAPPVQAQEPAPPAAPPAAPEAAPAPPQSGPEADFDSESSHGFAYGHSDDGESWAILNGPGGDRNFVSSNTWDPEVREQMDAAKRMAHGPALWFRHDGKSYILDDPATVARIEQLYKPMEALGRQQEALGKQQEALGKQMEAMSEQQRESIRVRLPDFSKEMADLQAALAKMKLDESHWDISSLAGLQAELQAKQGQLISPEKIAEIQAKVAEAQAELTSERMAQLQEKFAGMQARLGALQGEMGSRQGEFGAKMGALGAQQGRLGAQQGRLGAEQGRLAQQANREVRSIIEQALRNGKAKPVQ